MEINLQQLQRSHINLFLHSPPDNRLLEIFANGKRFSHKHVAHDDLKAVGHEWHHCVRLQSPTPGDDAKPLERGAMTQCLEELGASTEVWLFQPARINKNKSMGNSRLGRFQTRGKTTRSWGAGKWSNQCPPPSVSLTQAITFYLLALAVWHNKPDIASSELLLASYSWTVCAQGQGHK